MIVLKSIKIKVFRVVQCAPSRTQTNNVLFSSGKAGQTKCFSEFYVMPYIISRDDFKVFLKLYSILPVYCIWVVYFQNSFVKNTLSSK